MTSSDEFLFEALRNLLVGPERGEVESLRKRIEDPNLRRQEVETLLPEVLASVAENDRSIQDALNPLVVRSVTRALENEPARFVSALVPIMLPTIRKAVFAQLRSYIRSLEELIEQTLTLQSIRWRLVALRTGQSVREIALRDSFVSRVEELFLVHDATGLLAGHAALDDQRPDRDLDLVSGMLSAVQSFVRESFAREESSDLERLEFGAHELWIVRGRNTTLAAAVRGFGSPELRERLLQAVERIERSLRSRLADYSGSQDVAESVNPVLREYLEAREHKRKKWGRWPAVVLGALLLAFAALQVKRDGEDRTQVDKWVKSLQNSPGVVILSTSWKGSILKIQGLRDPLGPPLPAPPESPIQVETSWHGYTSTDPTIVVERVRRALMPPESIGLSLHEGTLVVTGTASHRWVERTRTVIPLIPGIERVDFGTIDADLTALMSALERAKQLSVRFPVGSTRPRRVNEVRDMISSLAQLELLAERAGRRLQLEIQGSTDPTGSEAKNQQLARARANYLLKALESLNLRRTELKAADDRNGTRERVARLRVGPNSVHPEESSQ